MGIIEIIVIGTFSLVAFANFKSSSNDSSIPNTTNITEGPPPSDLHNNLLKENFSKNLPKTNLNHTIENSSPTSTLTPTGYNKIWDYVTQSCHKVYTNIYNTLFKSGSKPDNDGGSSSSDVPIESGNQMLEVPIEPLNLNTQPNIIKQIDHLVYLQDLKNLIKICHNAVVNPTGPPIQLPSAQIERLRDASEYVNYLEYMANHEYMATIIRMSESEHFANQKQIVEQSNLSPQAYVEYVRFAHQQNLEPYFAIKNKLLQEALTYTNNLNEAHKLIETINEEHLAAIKLTAECFLIALPV